VYENLDHPTVANTSGGVPPEAWLEYRFNRVQNALGGDFQTRQHVGLFLGDESRITPGMEELEYTMFRFLNLNNRGFSLGSYDVKGVEVSTLQNYGQTGELLEKLKDWKNTSFALSPAQRAAMDTFRPVDGARASLNGNHPWATAFWRLDGPVLRKWLALGTDVYTHEWHSGQEHGTITPRFYLKNGETQPLQVPAELSGGADQVRVVGRVLPAFDAISASNIDLMSYMGTGNSLNIAGTNTTGSAVWEDEVQNSYSLSSTLDLTSKRGLGLWVTGDGSGATMVIRLSR
ncbi:hypothetical protein P4B35_23835, partial [Pontiellaceae bacterium B12227]|nr:hypothetical protein [Pontiellaceae bacterium B12227]